jgi:hypothetical protein
MCHKPRIFPGESATFHFDFMSFSNGEYRDSLARLPKQGAGADGT